MKREKRLSGKVLEWVRRRPEGTAVSAKELLHLAERAAVDQTLSRLARRGELQRVARGFYVAPIKSRFGSRPPRPGLVVESVAAHRGEEIARHGASTATVLGLTTQTPLAEVFITSGPSRTLRVGGTEVELRHAPRWQFAEGGKVGQAIRALAWMGPEEAREALPELETKLTPEELSQLVAARVVMPSWMAEEISQRLGRYA